MARDCLIVAYATIVAMWPVLLTIILSAEPSGAIAYTAVSQTEQCVYVLDLASGETTRIGTGKGDGAPRWSPDGSRLAFETRTDKGTAIYVVRADGSEGRLIDHAQAVNQSPRWSPDGRNIAYATGAVPTQRIAVFDLETNTETLWGSEQSGLMRPVWISGTGLLDRLISTEAPVGRSIAQLFIDRPSDAEGLLAIGFTGGAKNRSTDLFVVTPDETLPFPAWALPSQGTYAEWAVEPARRNRGMAFESNDGGDREVFVLTSEGVYDVSNHRAADWNPVWSPDAKWVAFESFRSGRRGIYRVHRGTNRVFPIAVSNDADNWSPDWSPDGQWLIFVSNRRGPESLYLTDYQGDQPPERFVIEGSPACLAPAWRPRTRSKAARP